MNVKQQESRKDIGFSVIIPTKNRPDLLDRALTSVLNQSLTNLEIIVVDDGSSASYEDVYLKYIDTVTFVSNSGNHGVANARNLGVQLASSEWIVFLDDDDEFFEGFLSGLHQKVNQFYNEIDFSWSSIINRGAHKKTKKNIDTPTYFKEKYENDERLHVQAMQIGCGYGFSIKRSTFISVGGFDTSFQMGEDTDLIFTLMSNGYRPLIYTDIGVIINDHQHNKLASDFTLYAKKQVYQRLIQKHQDYLSSHNDLMMIFFVWSAVVCYRAKMLSDGNRILKLMLRFGGGKRKVFRSVVRIGLTY